MAFQPPHRDKIPSMKRRCHTHDYRSVSYYMITLGKNPAYTAPFCRIFDAALNPPDFTSARRRSDELTPGIKRILLPRNASVRDKAGTAGSSVLGAPPLVRIARRRASGPQTRRGEGFPGTLHGQSRLVKPALQIGLCPITRNSK